MNIKFWLVIGLSLWLVGCNGYRISEATLNSAIEQRLEKTSPESIVVSIGNQFITLTLAIKRVNVSLLARENGVAQITMTTDLQGEMLMLGRQIALTTQLVPKLESAARFEQGAIYLVDPKLLSLQVNGSTLNDQLLRSVLGSVQQDFEVALQGFFAANPLYTLDHSPLERSASLLIKTISIADGELILSPF
jgi:hypothetical protein